MKYIYHLCLILCSIIVSCKDNNIEENVVTELITGLSIKIDSSNVDMGIRSLLDNFTISDNVYGTNVIYGGNLTDTEWGKQDTLFCRGKGHNEFQHPIFVSGCDSSIFLLNSSFEAGKLISLTIIPQKDSINAIKDVTKWENYDLSSLPAFRCVADNFVPMSDSTILILGAPYEDIGHIMSIIDYKKQNIIPLSYWPEDGNDCDSLPKHCLYTNYCKLFGNGKGRFLYQFEADRFAFIFSIEGKKINIKKELYNSIPTYKSSKSKSLYVLKEQSKERLTCATNSRYIYILLKEYDRKGNKLAKWVNPYVYGNRIEVFDWDGNKKKIIHLDKYGQRIFVTEDNKKLYLLNDDYFEDNSKLEMWLYNL